jgi:hypothetical protein
MFYVSVMGFHIDDPLFALICFADDTFHVPVSLILVSYVFSLVCLKCLLVDVSVDTLQLTVSRKL